MQYKIKVMYGTRAGLCNIKSDDLKLISDRPIWSVYQIDRRTTIQENWDFLSQEMNALIADTDASWEVYIAEGTSWKNETITLNSFLPAWEIKEEHPLAQKSIAAYRELMQKNPVLYRWDLSTNGVASAGKLGIPTIGFGAGIEKQAHTTDEYCPVSDILHACEFFTLLAQYV